MTIEHATTIEHTVGVDGVVVLRVPGGDLRLRATDGDAVHVRGDEDGVDRLTVERGDRTLSITAQLWRAPDLDVEIPAGASVVVETNADVIVTGLAGAQRYRTLSGDLRLRDVRGTIVAEAISGDVDIVTDGATAVSGRTVSGDVSVRAGDVGRLEAATTSGDVRVAGRFAGPGPFAIQTLSGDVTIAPAGPVRIEVATITGDVHADVDHRADGPRTRRVVEIGSGGPTFAVRTTSGDLRIVRAVVAEPTAETTPEPETTTALEPTAEVPAEPDIDVADETQVVDVPPTPDADSLTILRALERGDIDVDEAHRLLAEIDATEETR